MVVVGSFGYKKIDVIYAPNLTNVYSILVCLALVKKHTPEINRAYVQLPVTAMCKHKILVSHQM